MGIELAGHDIAAIAMEFQAVIEGSHFMLGRVAVFIDDTCHAVLAVMTICPIDARFTFVSLDGETVGPILAIQADAAIPAVDDHGRAVFAIDTDRTVNAILARFTFFANGDTVALDVLVHLDGQAAIGIPDDLEVFSGIIRIRFRAFPLDGQFLAQVTVNGDVIIALEIQAFRFQVFSILSNQISNCIKLAAINSVCTSCGKQPWRDILNPARSVWRTNTHNT